MEVPLQVSYRDFPPSAALETRIGQEVEKLETFYPSIISCRVLLELAHRHHQRGNPFHMRIEVGIPGQDVIVSHEPDLDLFRFEELSKSLEIDAPHKDIYVAIRDAFKAARRRLQDHARIERGAEKTHEPTALGRVCRLFPEKAYGFLETRDGREIYFHRNSVLNEQFDRLSVGSGVLFSEEKGDQGPQASTVKARRKKL